MHNLERHRVAARRADLLMVVGFFAILAYPNLVFFRDPAAVKEMERIENRVLSPRPPVWRLWAAPADFTREFKSFLDDQFEGRDQLVTFNSLTRYKALNASVDVRVIPGKHGSLFYAGEAVVPPRDFGHEAAKYRGVLKMSDHRLQRIREILTARKRWAEGMGAKFFFVIAPDKSTTYPELLPDWLDKGEGPTITDKLVDYLRSTSDIDLIDLRPPLQEAKRGGKPLFFMRDTHWNDEGAFVGYQEITQRLVKDFPAIKPLGPDDVVRKSQRRQGGDLAMMLHLQGAFWEPSPCVWVKSPRASVAPFRYNATPISSWSAPPISYEAPDPSLPKALIYHDSFMDRLMPQLVENFQSTIFIRDHRIVGSTIEGYRPDVVIHECVERNLYYLADMTDDLIPNPDPALLAEQVSPNSPVRR